MVPVSIILVYWKEQDRHEAYTSVVGFCEYHPAYSAEKIWNGPFRKKVRFEDDTITLTRVPVFGRKPKKK